MALQQPFPESLKETTPGSGPDFPGSSGDRERGKFRPSATPRLTAVAVTNDDGTAIGVGRSVEDSLAELLMFQEQMALYLEILAEDGVKIAGDRTGSVLTVRSYQDAIPFFDSAGDNTAQVMKQSSGVLYALEVSNPNIADAFIQLFDATAAVVTVGTTTPDLSLLVPAGASATVRGAMDKGKEFFGDGLPFKRAITYACTTTPTGNTAPSTSLTVNALYV